MMIFPILAKKKINRLQIESSAVKNTAKEYVSILLMSVITVNITAQLDQ